MCRCGFSRAVAHACAQFHAQLLLAGLDGRECCLWSMEPPRRNPHEGLAPGAAAEPVSPLLAPGAERAGGGGGSRSGASGSRGQHGRRDGAAAGSSWDASAAASGAGTSLWEADAYGRSPPGGFGMEGDGGGDERGGRGGRKEKKQPRQPKKQQTRCVWCALRLQLWVLLLCAPGVNAALRVLRATRSQVPQEERKVTCGCSSRQLRETSVA